MGNTIEHKNVFYRVSYFHAMKSVLKYVKFWYLSICCTKCSLSN